MRKIFTRMIGILGSFMMVLTMLPLTATAADLPIPAHEKYVTSNGDGTYTLTLNVTGREEAEAVSKPIDILLIVDRSGSMNDKIGGRRGTRKIVKIQNLISHLSSVVLPSGTNNQMAVVSFSGDDDWYDQAYDDATLNQIWTSDAGTISSVVNGLKPYGGTNWEAGLSVGKDAMDTLTQSGRDSQKYVVFLSDGNPTYRYDENGYTIGAGNATSDEDVSEAITVAKTIGATFYSVGIGGSVTRMKGLANEVTGTYYDGTTESALDEAFAAIEQQLVKNFKGIVISDTLSDYAEMVDQTDLRVSAADADGNPVDVPADAAAAYDEASKTVTWTFPSDYVLKANVTYSVSFDIRATRFAQQEYVNQGNKYPSIGDDGTGETSAGQEGFFSNSSATLGYVSVNGSSNTPLSSDYAKPVIQVTSPIKELPKAGGPGTWWLYAIGFGMMGFAATLLIIQKKRNDMRNRGGLYD